MSYNANIPQPGDKLRISQNDILLNFQGISTGFDFDHTALSNASPGRHKKLTMPRQSFPQAVTGTDLLFYVGLNASTTLSELYFKRSTDAGNGIPITGKLVPAGLAKGWTYLPSGVIMQWGEGTVLANGSTTIDFVALGGIAYSTAGSATGNYVVTVSLNQQGTNTVTLQTTKVNEQSFAVVSKNITGGAGNTIPFTWMTIGV